MTKTKMTNPPWHVIWSRIIYRSLEQDYSHTNSAEMVAHRRLASVVASAVAATLSLIVENINLIQKAITDRNIMINLKPRGYSPRFMQELLAWRIQRIRIPRAMQSGANLSIEANWKHINTVEMVAHRRKILTVASAVVATMFMVVKNIRKKMLIEEAVTD